MEKTESGLTTQIDFSYDADGLRISKTSGDMTTKYYYTAGRLTHMTLSDADSVTGTMHFTYDTVGPATVSYNGSVYYYLRNAQGDVTGLVDASGNQVVNYSYDAWGSILHISDSTINDLGTVNPLRYRGYIFDDETGLYYLKTRYYNPEWGRFINVDSPAVPTISPESSTSNKNSFAYCDNNPVNRVDDEGQCPHIIVGAIIGGIVGFVSTAITDCMSKDGFSLGRCMISAGFGAITGALAASGVGFGASIALNALFGAGESVALDLYDNQCPERTHHGAGEIIFNAAVSAGTSALFSCIPDSSNWSQMNDLYGAAQRGEKYLVLKGNHPNKNGFAIQAIRRYYYQLGRRSIRMAATGVFAGTAIKGLGMYARVIYASFV